MDLFVVPTIGFDPSWSSFDWPTELVWIDATPHPTGCKRKTLSEILEWGFRSALFLACDGRLLQIELALDASARLVGNFALAQQPVDEFLSLIHI